MSKRRYIQDPVMHMSFAAVALVALGSFAYFVIASRPPKPDLSSVQEDRSVVSVSGTVTPAQNPDLAFESGGRVTKVAAQVGQHVSRGALLASLDTATLAAVRDQAAANVRAQKARLDDIKAGPRDVDISQKKTAVEQAKQSLADAYQDAQVDTASSYSSIVGAVRLVADPLFNNPNGTSPTLIFSTSNTQLSQQAAQERLAVANVMSVWASEQRAPGSDNDATETALTASVAHVAAMQSFVDALASALGAAITSSSFSQTSLTSAQANTNTMRSAVQGALSDLRNDSQAIAAAKLSVQSAQNALDAAKAGATSQQIEAQEAAVQAAQASLNAANASLSHALVVAPYDGEVTAVNVSVGDLVNQNQVAVSLVPRSKLQLMAYLSEIDSARVSAGDMADVTLDAYGASRTFSAVVASVNRSPVSQAGVPAYRVVLQFSQEDAAISPGMTGNAIIHISKTK